MTRLNKYSSHQSQSQQPHESHRIPTGQVFCPKINNHGHFTRNASTNKFQISLANRCPKSYSLRGIYHILCNCPSFRRSAHFLKLYLFILLPIIFQYHLETANCTGIILLLFITRNFHFFILSSNPALRPSLHLNTALQQVFSYDCKSQTLSIFHR